MATGTSPWVSARAVVVRAALMASTAGSQWRGSSRRHRGRTQALGRRAGQTEDHGARLAVKVHVAHGAGESDG